MIQLVDPDMSEESSEKEPQDLNSGCKGKRSLKAEAKKAANRFSEQLPLIDAVTSNDVSPKSPIGKRQRPATSKSEFNKYYEKTLKKIAEIEKKIKVTTDKKEVKRLKIMISAYGSRLHKREDVE